MFRFAVPRCAYSILIMFGVLVLIFLHFRVAAGDPAALVVGRWAAWGGLWEASVSAYCGILPAAGSLSLISDTVIPLAGFAVPRTSNPASEIVGAATAGSGAFTPGRLPGQLAVCRLPRSSPGRWTVPESVTQLTGCGAEFGARGDGRMDRISRKLRILRYNRGND